MYSQFMMHGQKTLS